jgi:hypothetical protein
MKKTRVKMKAKRTRRKVREKRTRRRRRSPSLSTVIFSRVTPTPLLVITAWTKVFASQMAQIATVVPASCPWLVKVHFLSLKCVHKIEHCQFIPVLTRKQLGKL